MSNSWKDKDTNHLGKPTAYMSIRKTKTLSDSQK